MKVLITGGAGFVGRHTCKKYLEMGCDVTIVDNYYSGSGCLPVERWPDHLKPSNPAQLTSIEQDCRQFFAETKEEFDVIVHLAAVVGGRLVIENDPLAVGIDLAIDADFFYWLSRITFEPKRILYLSSSAAYPIAHQRAEGHQLLTEDMISFEGGAIGQPDLTYGWAKLTGEYLAQITHEKYGHHITCFRPFSGYGEDQDLSYPFPAILKRAIDKLNPMTVWGSGRQMRDFIYIDDCIDSMVTIADQVGDASAINLSTGIPTSFNEYAKLAYEVVNGADDSLTVENTSDKPEGVFARYGSTDLQEKYGARYKYSFREGIERCLDLFSHR